MSTAPSRSLPDLIGKYGARAAELSPEAATYWARHAGRFEYVLRLLDGGYRTRARTALDVGASFHTPMLAEYFPEWHVDSLGNLPDDPFTLPPPSRHFRFDLNEAGDSSRWPAFGRTYDLIVFMEVLEHLFAPPSRVLRFLGAQLAPGGVLLLTTPNAAWLKNRLKMLRGRNPFEPMREGGGGHIREYTLDELKSAAGAAGLTCAEASRRGLYRFSGAKDRFYSSLADATLSGLRRTIVMVLRADQA